MPMIDLGKMRDKYDDSTLAPSKPKKNEKYYPEAYMDNVGNVSIDDLPVEKDIEVKAVIRITSAKKRETKDKEGKKITVDINFEIRSIDFAPDSKKKEEKGETGTKALQEAIEDGLSKK